MMNYQVTIKTAHFRGCCYVTAPNAADARARAIEHISTDNSIPVEELDTAQIKVRYLQRGDDTILYEQLEREGRI